MHVLFYTNKTLYQDVVMQFMLQIKLHMQTGQTNTSMIESEQSPNTNPDK